MKALFAGCLFAGLAAGFFLAANSAIAAQDNADAVPGNLVDDARQAKEAFQQGHYADCQKIYERMLTAEPRSISILSNLGVIYFRNAKSKLAEDCLQKAVALDPKDEFSQRTLGIVYYAEKRYGDALRSINAALSIDPKDETALDYKTIIEHASAPSGVSPAPGAPASKDYSPGDYPTEHERELHDAAGVPQAFLQ